MWAGNYNNWPGWSAILRFSTSQRWHVPLSLKLYALIRFCHHKTLQPTSDVRIEISDLPRIQMMHTNRKSNISTIILVHTIKCPWGFDILRLWCGIIKIAAWSLGLLPPLQRVIIRKHCNTCPIFILMFNVVFCRLKCTSIPHGVFHSYLRCQHNERAPLLLSIQSKTGKAVNCMAPLPLMLWSSLGILSASTPFSSVCIS